MPAMQDGPAILCALQQVLTIPKLDPKLTIGSRRISGYGHALICTRTHTLVAAGEEGDTRAGQPLLPVSPATRSAAGAQDQAGPEVGRSAP